MAKFCEQFFYPENHPGGDIYCLFETKQGGCEYKNHCVYQLNLNKEEHAILDNLRIVKEQNAAILTQLQKQNTK